VADPLLALQGQHGGGVVDELADLGQRHLEAVARVVREADGRQHGGEPGADGREHEEEALPAGSDHGRQGVGGGAADSHGTSSRSNYGLGTTPIIMLHISSLEPVP